MQIWSRQIVLWISIRLRRPTYFSSKVGNPTKKKSQTSRQWKKASQSKEKITWLLWPNLFSSNLKVITFSPVATAQSFYIFIYFSPRHFILCIHFLLFQTSLLRTGYICSFKAKHNFSVIYKHYYEILLVKKKSRTLVYFISWSVGQEQ